MNSAANVFEQEELKSFCKHFFLVFLSWIFFHKINSKCEMKSLIKAYFRPNISASGKMFFFVKYFLASEFKGILFKSLLFFS